MNVSLHALDDRDSLLWANNDDKSQGFAYSPFGSTLARSDGDSVLPGFNGERLDPVNQSYNLGNGYRTYNPVLMRFNAPDSWSPFGDGGLNQYAYCEGDPINRSDPSGHMSSGAAMGLGIGLGILGLLGAVFTFGQSIAAAAAAEAALTASMAADLLGTGLGVASSMAHLASAVTRESDPEVSRDLGWASLALGVAAFGMHAPESIESKLGKSSESADLLGGSGDEAHGGVGAESSDGEMVLGGKPKGVNALADGILTFEDTYKGRRRLNLVAHGSPQSDGTAKMWIGDLEVTPEQLVKFLDASGTKYKKFDYIRTVMCQSGNGLERSFANQLSLLIKKPVKGYIGDVYKKKGFMPEVADKILKIKNPAVRAIPLRHLESEPFVLHKTPDYQFCSMRFGRNFEK